MRAVLATLLGSLWIPALPAGEAMLSWHLEGRRAEGVWKLPESRELGRLAVRKLAEASGRIGVQAPPMRRSVARVLLSSLLANEHWGEIREDPRGELYLAVAVRLPPEGRDFLGTALEDYLDSQGWEGPRPLWGSEGWTAAPRPGSDRLFRLASEGDWLLAGTGPDALSPLPAWQASLAGGRPPSVLPEGAFLRLEGSADRILERLAGSGLPWVGRFRLVLANDGEGRVRTEGGFRLGRPLELPLPGWSIPVEAIHDPIVGFSGTRGLAGFLGELPLPGALRERGLPAQWFTWSRVFSRSSNALPFFPHYAAWPVGPGEAGILDLAHDLPAILGEDLMASGRIRLAAQPQRNETVVHLSPPLVQPSVRGLSRKEGSVRLVGLFPHMDVSRPAPPELFQQLESRPGLVHYQWEITQNRIDMGGSLLQMLCFLFSKPQMESGSAGMRWLEAIAPRLGSNSVTLVTAEAPDRLKLVRKSGSGLAALELVLLARWLESGSFPFIDPRWLSRWELNPAAPPLHDPAGSQP